MAQRKAKRRNINFRQTPREFKAERQTKSFSVMNRNVPYRVYTFSKKFFDNQVGKLKNQFFKISTKLPKGAKKVK
jgi:hypothetical protein